MTFKGKKIEVTVDDHIVCYGDEPIFARSHENEIWVLLLEKVWAKLHGGFYAIQFGNALEAMKALTGAPTNEYIIYNDN